MKILQVFFKNQGETFILKKNLLISLSFLGLLYVLDDYKQKNFFFQKKFLTKIGYFLCSMEFGWFSDDG